MRNWSVKNIEDRKYDFIPFSPRFASLFGQTELTGNWIVYGKSGQGKSAFCLQLAKEFDEMGKRVLFVSLEMGDSYEFQQSLRRAGITGGNSNILFTGECPPDELAGYLEKQRSADVVMVDSLQYFIDMYRVKTADFIALRNRFRKKVFIYISHMKGNEVDGETAYDLKKDAFKRVYIEHFKAVYKGRGNGGDPGFYVIWPKGYREFWLEDGSLRMKNE
ncbi:MAG TPA: hypothetical protein H9752_04580 [Candidatus Phocaeicola excrementigallinarum]|nr:hypothetical protein [Candidatus Phocaeicola excrementigallinarum]